MPLFFAGQLRNRKPENKKAVPDGTAFYLYIKSVADLLDIADVDIVQHIAALSQNAGESTDNVQHDRNSFRYFLINLNSAYLTGEV